jgi:uncharacterized membrane protein YdjX (TVP38/TMEM64 family)
MGHGWDLFLITRESVLDLQRLSEFQEIWGKAAFGKMFSEKQIKRYEAWTRKNGKFLKLFAAAIFFPVAPDDLLCYLAGTTAMTWKQFLAIILLGKPFSIALYSMGLTKLFQLFFLVR